MSEPIPKDLAAAIKKCWPNGEIEEFPTDESYFQDIHERLARGLRKIRGASLIWQTEDHDSQPFWDDFEDELHPCDYDWQSYHVFFLAPDDAEFHFEDEIKPMEEPDEENECPQTIPGEGWIGLAVGVSLAMPWAA